MKQHYSEADLLETYYTQPGASMPVMMHLADCGECASRYERLEKKVRGLSSCAHDRPETFWARQRVSIMKKIEKQKPSYSFARVAAAAAIVLMLSMRVSEPPVQPHVVAVQTAEEVMPLEETPWQSDELNDLHSMVAWESWIDSAGDHSL
ncbi:MAG TPA: hypothetical protein VJZ00_11300 [Thermoanaerobaculia bacterium]|nr:hypothetical protein [Thermoanaerobaculia bacterium]